MTSEHIKVFKKDVGSLKEGGSATASSNTDLANLILDGNKFTSWTSTGSDDLTTESLIVTFAEEKDIDRIFLLGINFKLFDVEYWDGAAYQPFTSVEGLDGSLSGIDVTGYDKSTAYFEFDQVTTSMIKIECTATQIVDEEKTMSRFLATEERGTFLSFPLVQSFTTNNISSVRRVMSGKTSVQYKDDSVSFGLNSTNNTNQADWDLLNLLVKVKEPSLWWPCGGKFDSPNFNVTKEPYRLEDVFQMSPPGPAVSGYALGILINPFDYFVPLTEAI